MMSATSTGDGTDTGSPRIFQVDKDGDVILVVGMEKDRIQVLASFLKRISPVFRAMLDGPMIEGDALRNKSTDVPVKIAVPEDDSRAMLLTLQALDGIVTSLELSSGDMRRIALLADKYDFTKRLNYFGSYRLGNLVIKEAGQTKWWDILMAAYSLKCDQPFFDITKKIVASDLGLLYYAKNESDRELSMQLGMAIEELRNASRVHKNYELGMCLECFMNNNTSFVLKGSLCKHPERHPIQGWRIRRAAKRPRSD